MNMLVAVASRHGSTTEIAEAIAQELRMANYMVDVRSADEVSTIAAYDAVVIGSAIYMGNWLIEARQFVDRYQDQLACVPVWLFSSGPLGEDPHPQGDPNMLGELMAATKARGHTIFVGKLDKHNLGLGERLITRAVGAPGGDFRDWEAIRAWAREIAHGLETPVVMEK